MKFDNFQYQRPIMEAFENQFNDSLNGFENATSFEEQDSFFRKDQHPPTGIFYHV